MTVRLSELARKTGLLHPNQCGSLPGLSTSDACATLIHEVRTLQRPRWAVSTLFPRHQGWLLQCQRLQTQVPPSPEEHPLLHGRLDHLLPF